MEPPALKTLATYNVDKSPYRNLERLANTDALTQAPRNSVIRPNKQFSVCEDYDHPVPCKGPFKYPTLKINGVHLPHLVPERLLPRGTHEVLARFRYRSRIKKSCLIPDLLINTRLLTVTCSEHSCPIASCTCFLFVPLFCFIIERIHFPRLLVYAKHVAPDFTKALPDCSLQRAYWSLDDVEWIVYRGPTSVTSPVPIPRPEPGLPKVAVTLKNGLLFTPDVDNEENDDGEVPAKKFRHASDSSTDAEQSPKPSTEDQVFPVAKVTETAPVRPMYSHGFNQNFAPFPPANTPVPPQIQHSDYYGYYGPQESVFAHGSSPTFSYNTGNAATTSSSSYMDHSVTRPQMYE